MQYLFEMMASDGFKKKKKVTLYTHTIMYNKGTNMKTEKERLKEIKARAVDLCARWQSLLTDLEIYEKTEDKKE